jgi:hypothetical protein
MKLTELLIDAEDAILQAPMIEMANLFPTDTGLQYAIWFGEVDGQHGPRVKVSNIRGKFAASDNFVISVTREPKILTPKSVKINIDDQTDITDWIKLNYDDLMKMWKVYETGDGSLVPIIQDLKKL